MKVLIMGGDARQGYAGIELARLGYEVAVAPLKMPLEEAKGGGDVLLLPVPCTKDGKHLNAPLEEAPLLWDVGLSGPGRIFGGAFSCDFLKGMRREGKVVTDLLSVPSFVEENAVLTAEAALGVGMEACKRSFRKTTIGIVGYGRIASRLARLLLLMGAEVLVFARKEEARLAATLDGACAYDLTEMKAELPRVRLLYNTAPAPLLTKETTATLRDCAVVELASGKENITLGNTQGVTLTFAHSLPGKILPVSAGTVIARTLHQILKKEGHTPKC